MTKVFEEKEENKKTSKFQSFLLLFFIPMLFAITVALVVMTISGFNVFELTKDIGKNFPFAATEMEEKNQESSIEHYQTKMNELEKQINERETKIEQLETQVDDKDQEIRQAKLEKERLQQEIEELSNSKKESVKEFKEIVETYETISAKKAAPIITAMEEQEALMILASLNADTLANIMEEMAPEDAAKFTQLLAEDTQ